jgi:RNA polymerase sigma-70 factor (ECF subfamily)
VDLVLCENLPENQAEEEPDTPYDTGKITRGIDRLPDGYRIILTLYLLEGYDHTEIAKILGISESTSKSQYSRAKDKLRAILSNN